MFFPEDQAYHVPSLLEEYLLRKPVSTAILSSNSQLLKFWRYFSWFYSLFYEKRLNSWNTMFPSSEIKVIMWNHSICIYVGTTSQKGEPISKHLRQLPHQKLMKPSLKWKKQYQTKIDKMDRKTLSFKTLDERWKIYYFLINKKVVQKGSERQVS